MTMDELISELAEDMATVVTSDPNAILGLSAALHRLHDFMEARAVDGDTVEPEHFEHLANTVADCI